MFVHPLFIYNGDNKMFLEKPYTGQNLVTYSVKDPAIIANNSPELIEKFREERNPDILNTDGAVKFLLKSLTPFEHEEIKSQSEPSFTVRSIYTQLKSLYAFLEVECGLLHPEDKSDFVKQLEYLKRSADQTKVLIDSLSESERNEWDNYQKKLRVVPLYWCAYGVESVEMKGEILSWDDMTGRVVAAAYLELASELAIVIQRMSELGDFLEKS